MQTRIRMDSYKVFGLCFYVYVFMCALVHVRGVDMYVYCASFSAQRQLCVLIRARSLDTYASCKSYKKATVRVDVYMYTCVSACSVHTHILTACRKKEPCARNMCTSKEADGSLESQTCIVNKDCGVHIREGEQNHNEGVSWAEDPGDGGKEEQQQAHRNPVEERPEVVQVHRRVRDRLLHHHARVCSCARVCLLFY